MRNSRASSSFLALVVSVSVSCLCSLIGAAEPPTAGAPLPEGGVAVAEGEAAVATAARAGLTAEIRAALYRGARSLRGGQNPDGGFGPFGEKEVRVPNTSDVGITAFGVYALARAARTDEERSHPSIARAVEFLLERQQPDGAFYDEKDPTLKTYKTSVVLLALHELDPAKYSPAIRKGQDFIKAQQADAEKGYEREGSADFGGMLYGDEPKISLSVSEYAAEALHETGVSAADEVWAPLVVYVARCRNSRTVDPVLAEAGIGTTGDLGFRYAPADTRGPAETLDGGLRVFSSYGSMTYAALKTLLYARLDRNDPLVQDTISWIAANFTVRENPGMATRANPRTGLHGVYYYYHAMAKALAALGEPVIRDHRGVEHEWARELSRHLIALQREDGAWVNEEPRWYEGLPSIATSYAVVALDVCLDFLQRGERPEGGR